MLNAFISEIRSGQRAQSVVSSMTTESLSPENDDFWANLRRELEDIGISKVAIDTRRNFIIHRIIDALFHEGSESDDQGKSHEASFELSSGRTHELEQPVLGEPDTSTSLTVRMREPEKEEPAPPQRTPKNSRVRPSLRSFFRKSKLLEVVRDENIAKVQECLENGDSPNRKEKRGSSALFLAAELEHTAIATVLCENGADVNAANSDHLQRTALHEAASRGNETLVQLLLKHGAQPDAKDAENCTPFHRAIIGLESLIPSDLFRSGWFMYFGPSIHLSRSFINERMKKDRAARAANDKPMEWKVRKYERVVELLLSTIAARMPMPTSRKAKSRFHIGKAP
jgi:ankyrin repeat protein